MAWGTIAAAGISAGAGIIGGAVKGKKGRAHQEKLLDVQHSRNKELMDEGKRNELDIWDKTNFKAQVKHAKAAGLSPALLYGGAGAGGATTGGGGVPSTDSGASGGNMYENLGALGIEGAEAVARIKNMNADTSKKEAEVENVKETTVGTGLDNKLKDQTMTSMIDMAVQSAESKYQEGRQIKLANEWEDFIRIQPKGEVSAKETQLRSEIDKTITQTAEINKMIEAIGAEIGVKNANIANLDEDTNLRNQMMLRIKEQRPEELETIKTELSMAKKELEKMQNDPSYTRYGQIINYSLDRLNQVTRSIGDVKGMGKQEKELPPTQTTTEKQTSGKGYRNTTRTTSYK